MKKLTTILSAAALLLPSIGLYAQESDAVISQSGSSGNGFFAYADYYQYIGVGAQGDLVAKESITNYAFIYEQMNKLYSATPVGTIFKTTGTAKNPDGNLQGATVGYSWTTKNNSRCFVQFSFREGDIDTTTGDSRIINIDKSVLALTSAYEQSIHEYHIQASYAPQNCNYLTFGAEYSYSSNTGAFIANKEIYDIDGSLFSKDNIWRYGFDSKNHDILLHSILKTPAFTIAKTSSTSFSFMPRVDLAVGYSFRDASLNTGTGLNVYSSYEPQSLLKDDSFIFESTATLGFYYQIQNSTIILDAGYRYKSDLGSGTYGTDQKGVYGRLGYTYSW